MKYKKYMSLILAFVFAFILASASYAYSFTDTAGSAYADEIDYCKFKGYILGVSSTEFMPEGNLTRGQFAVVWCRFMNYKTDSSFTDIAPLTPQSYYDVAAYLLYGTKVMTGTSATTFEPNGIVTREQMATIVARAEKLSATDPDAYKWYKDYTSVSDWATEPLSACINNNVFRGLYTSDNFEPGTPVTRAEVCKMLYNLDSPKHTVTIATLSGGTITASPNMAHAGESITLTITPDAGKQLKDGSLKYDGIAISGTSFLMPPRDTVISAEFENVPPSPSPTETPIATETPSPTLSPEVTETPSPSLTPEETAAPSPAAT